MNQNISQEELERIERYRYNRMEEDERKDFELQLKNNAQLSAAFEMEKNLMDGIEEKGLKDKMNDFHEVFDTEASTTKMTKERAFPFKKKYYFRAAAVALLVSIGSVWFINRPTQNERLFTQYFIPDAGLPTTMGTDDDYAFSRAMVDYKYGEYQSAITKWEIQLTEKPKNDTLHYYLGAAHLANGEILQAVPFLKYTSRQKGSVFLDKAYFYLGLSYLKQGKLALAKENFEKSKLEESSRIISKLKD